MTEGSRWSGNLANPCSFTSPTSASRCLQMMELGISTWTSVLRRARWYDQSDTEYDLYLWWNGHEIVALMNGNLLVLTLQNNRPTDLHALRSHSFVYFLWVVSKKINQSKVVGCLYRFHNNLCFYLSVLQVFELHSGPKPVVFVLHSFLSAKLARLGLLT